MTAGAAVSAAVLEGDDEEGKESFGMKGNEKEEEEEEEEKEQQGEKVNTKQLLIITTERAADLVHSKWLSLFLSHLHSSSSSSLLWPARKTTNSTRIVERM